MSGPDEVSGGVIPSGASLSMASLTLRGGHVRVFVNEFAADANAAVVAEKMTACAACSEPMGVLAGDVRGIVYQAEGAGWRAHLRCRWCEVLNRLAVVDGAVVATVAAPAVRVEVDRV